MAQQYDIRRKKNLLSISPFAGYQFKDQQLTVMSNSVTGKEISVRTTKNDDPKLHNFLVNLRNSQTFI